ncbi:MAG: class I SAM-dependent methyltransferase [Armatimonadetes bacterium]|nr:class I SAM-dependent methyltransferase [Armatimonadota bacterium]
MSTLHPSTKFERIESLQFDYSAQPKQPMQNCNLCGSDRWVVITQRDRYGFPAKATTCANCGLTRLNPPMTSEAYTDFYINTYRPLVSAYHGRLIDAKSIQGEQVSYAESYIEFARPFITPGHQTLLDVGGSTGIVAIEFQKAFGLKPTIIDPAPAEIAEADRYNLETITGFVEEWDHLGQTYDVIGLFQTIDHLLDVQKTLSKLREVISPNGLFLVDIVDFRAAYLRNNSVEEAVKIDHVFSLTEQTAEALFLSHGFEWIRKSYSADHLHVAYVCRPVDPRPFSLPRQDWVESHLNEIRKVQNSR